MVRPMPTQSEFLEFREVLKDRKKEVASAYNQVQGWIMSYYDDLLPGVQGEIDSYLEDTVGWLADANEHVDGLINEAEKRRVECKTYTEAMEKYRKALPGEHPEYPEKPGPYVEEGE